MQWHQKTGLILCFILAILLHATMSFIFLHTLHHHRDIAGTPYAKLIHTYLYPLDVLDRHLRGSNTKMIHLLHKQQQDIAQSHALRVLPDRTGNAVAHDIDHRVVVTPSEKSAIKGSGQLDQRGDSALLVLLHNQIQQHNHYPEQAIQLQQTGRVAVRFYVLPTGKIEQIRVAKSSGIASLDQAAVSAVAKSSPLPLSKDQLKAPRLFTIQLHYN